MKLEHFLTTYTKINSKWIKDLNIRPETIKILEKNIGKTLSKINHSRILYDPPPGILEIKAKINKLDLSSVQFSCSVVSDSLQPHVSQHTRPPCPSPTPGVHSDSRPWSQ